MTQGAEAPRVGLQQLLRAMVEKGASDMHITVGVPPLLRIDGEVIPLKLPPLTKEDTKQLCYSVMTEEQKIQFEKHSELDLAFGDVRLKRGGGEAGHNGLKSVSQHLATKDYVRLRFGVGKPPAGFRGSGADFVLEGFAAAERARLGELVDLAADAVGLFVERGLEHAMNVTNRRPS